MEFLNCLTETSKLNGKAGGGETAPQNQKSLVILSIIKVALAADFARFENNRHAKTLIQQLQTKAHLESPAVTRSASQPPHRSSKISKPHLPKKQSQKSLPSKGAIAGKAAPQKQAQAPVPAGPGPSKSSKNASSQSTTKSACPKGKKKIHKVHEGKRDHCKRLPEPLMLTTAQPLKMGFSEKQKRKIRRMLLLRQMKDTNRPEEGRREGRELRAQH